MGGEKHLPEVRRHCLLGSPLRGRGKEDRNNGTAWLYRITPAWAGKSREIPLHLRAAKDHPRVGGEKFGGEGLR